MKFLVALLCLLPSSSIKNRLLSVMPGFSIAPEAHFGPSLVWNVRQLHLATGARIGAFNVLKDLLYVQLEAGATIGHLNWFSGALVWIDQARAPEPSSLLLSEFSTINARHYLDCSGGFRMGKMARLAGNRSTVFTHLIDPELDEMIVRPVEVGSATYIQTNVVLTPGAVVGPKIVVAAGAVVSGELNESEALYGGVPAKFIRSLEGAPLFQRTNPQFTDPAVVRWVKDSKFRRSKSSDVSSSLRGRG